MSQRTAETMTVPPSPTRRSRRARRTLEIVDLFPPQGQWTEEDYLALPETNRIVELSAGRVVMPDMPTTSHQRAVGRLFRLMSDHADRRKLGEVCVAPLRVRLWPGQYREPDLVFMHRDHADRIGEEFWGVPDLVVEVISPRTPQSSGTEKTDRQDKFREYAQAGVAEYWLVHPVERTIEVYVLRGEGYERLGRWSAGEAARSEVLAGLEVPVNAVVEA